MKYMQRAASMKPQASAASLAWLVSSSMLFVLMCCLSFMMMNAAYGVVPPEVNNLISQVNQNGPYLGIVVPNNFEMEPLLQSPSFLPDQTLPFIDLAGRRFRLGTLENQKVIIVMTGLSMVNAGITTQLLLSFFEIKGVVHFGVAGNANPDLEIGDVTIPKYWAHTGLWNWQRYGDGPNDTLALEVNGDYTREIGDLQFSDYNTLAINRDSLDNLLNRVWYQPEEIFSIDGEPEIRQHVFWIPVDANYLSVAEKLKDLDLESCVETTCLPRPPSVVQVERGITASVFVDNKAYREFLYSKFNAAPVDMESGAVALICLQQKTPFIAIRALSDLAGGGSSISNEADLFAPLASQNAVTVFLKFIALLSETTNQSV